MGNTQYYRHRQQQGGNAKGELNREHTQQQMRSKPGPGRHGRTEYPPPQQRDQNSQHPGNESMIELHGRHIADEVCVPRVEHEHVGRDEVPVHQWKRVVGETRPQPGHQSA